MWVKERQKKDNHNMSKFLFFFFILSFIGWGFQNNTGIILILAQKNLCDNLLEPTC